VSLVPPILGRHEAEGNAMSARELVVTILGLAGTFLMPWPGEADRPGDPLARGRQWQASVCVRDCGEAVAMGRKDAGSRANPVDAKRLAQSGARHPRERGAPGAVSFY
jgi:hypothetical protein